MPKTHFSVRIDREDGPAVVVTVRRPTEAEAVDYWQHRQDAEDPKRAAHGGHADSAAEIMGACVVSIVAAPVKGKRSAPTGEGGESAPPVGAPATPSNAAPPLASEGAALPSGAVPFVPAIPLPGAAAGAAAGATAGGAAPFALAATEGADPLGLGGGSPSDQFRALREEYPHLPRQLHSRFVDVAGGELTIANVEIADLPADVQAKCRGRKVRAVVVDATPRLDAGGKLVKGSSGKPLFDGKLVVLSRLTATEVEFIDAAFAQEGRQTPTGEQSVKVAKSHLIECPPGLFGEYPLLPLHLGQLLYGAAAAKIGGVQGE